MMRGRKAMIDKKYYSEKKISSSESIKKIQQIMGLFMIIICEFCLLAIVLDPNDFDAVELIFYVAIGVGGIVLFVFGLLSFMAAHLKMKHCKKHWQEIGELEITPRELRRSAKHFAQLGLMIVAFIVSKSLVLEIFPDWYDITAIFVPFSICVYLVAKSRGRR